VAERPIFSVSVYQMISAEKARFPVSLQCELLSVSRSGYAIAALLWIERSLSASDLEQVFTGSWFPVRRGRGSLEDLPLCSSRLTLRRSSRSSSRSSGLLLSLADVDLELLAHPTPSSSAITSDDCTLDPSEQVRRCSTRGVRSGLTDRRG